MKKSTKAIIAVVVAVAVIAGTVFGVTWFGNSKEETAEPVEQSVEDVVKEEELFKVSFALSDDMTTQKAGATKLPETMSVAPGTKISTLEKPKQSGGIFLGWYYDAKNTALVGAEDTVQKDLTLYPRFATKEGYENDFSLNYISQQDVAPEFTVKLVGYGLSLEEVSSLVKVWNVSGGSSEEEFVVKTVSSAGDEVNSSDSVILGGEDSTPEEGYQLFVPEQTLNDELAAFDIDWENATEESLKEQFGIDKEDSLIRYFREDLEIDIEDAYTLEEILEKSLLGRKGTYYEVSAPNGAWAAGQLHQIEITDTSRLRFVYQDEITEEKIIYYNFSVYREVENSLQLKDGMVYIPYAEVQGVELGGGVFRVEAGEDGSVSENQGSGTLTYNAALTAGQSIAVYDGTLNADGTVDGEVGYFTITKSLGNNKYAYTTASFEDVVFIPDVIPVPDDGSFSDHQITLPATFFQFSDTVYRQFKLDAGTKVEPRDYIACYNGSIRNPESMTSTGYGRITSVEKTGDSYVLTYEEVVVEDLMSSFGMFTTVDNVEVPVSEELSTEMEQDLLNQAKESGFVEDAATYLVSLVTDDEFDLENSQYSEELKNFAFNTSDGDEITVEELRLLADGGAKKVEVSDPTINFAMSPTLQHFSGEGVRAELSVGFKVEIELNTTGNQVNKIEIQCTLALQQEIVLGLDVSADAEWVWYAFIPVLDEVTVQAAVRAGTYTGFGAVATVTTGSDSVNEDTEWNNLIKTTNSGLDKEVGGLNKLAGSLESLSKNLNTIQNGGGYTKEKGKDGAFSTGEDDDGAQTPDIGGDLPSKYSGMMDNDAEYINLVKKELFRIAASPDPLHLIEFSLEADFVVSLKINCMMGAGISYANAKQYCFEIKVFEGESTSSNADLETPNFRADFYVFGMIGVRAGILLDARVGLISTKIDSVGITAEAGLYAELYGFLYVYYTWESGKGSDSGAMGSLLFEVGAYLDINFVAQLGDGKLSTGAEIYSNQWPFLQLGATEVPMDFTIDEDDEILEIEYEEGTSTVKLPDELYQINMMDLKTGEISEMNQDSPQTGASCYDIVVNNRKFVQYGEEHFDVDCMDTDKDGNPLGTRSFRYLPATNELSVKPVESDVDELWGVVTFTYKNETFGFNTVNLSRSVKVHWIGKPASAVVEYYQLMENGEYELVKEGTFDGFNGVEYDIVVTEDFIYQIKGYKLRQAYFTDEEKMWDKVEEYREASLKVQREYSKGRVSWDKVKEASDKHTMAYNSYTEYWHNIADCIMNKEGTMSFMMSSNETVVQLFFDPVSYYVYFYENPFIYQDTYLGVHQVSIAEIPLGDAVLDHVPEEFAKYLEDQDMYDYAWYMYGFDHTEHVTGALEGLRNKDQLISVDAETVMPDQHVVIYAMPDKVKEYNVTFKSRGKELETIQVPYDEEIPFPEKPERENYYFVCWTNEKTKERLTEGTRISNEDQVYVAEWEPNGYPIHVTLKKPHGTYTFAFNGIYSHNLLRTLNENDLIRQLASSEEEGNLVWYLESEDGESVIETEWAMPNFEITVEGRYESEAEHEHLWGEGRVIQAPTCTTEGEREYICSICSQRKVENIAIDPNAHNSKLVVRGAVEETCGKDGYTGDEYCPDCNQIVVKGKVIPANGRHDYGAQKIYTASTCITHGGFTGTCLVCGHQEVEISPLDPNNHEGSKEIRNAKEAGCTTEGYTGDTYCTGCKKLISTGTAIPALGHLCSAPEYQWSEDLTSVTGSVFCERENKYFKETVSAVRTVTKQATCLKTGESLLTATFTNKLFTVQTKVVEDSKLFHDYGVPAYTWAADKKSCTAVRTCKHDSTHTESETVETNIIEQKPLSDGKFAIIYKTNPFMNSAFAIQTTTEERVGCAEHVWMLEGCSEPLFYRDSAGAFILYENDSFTSVVMDNGKTVTCRMEPGDGEYSCKLCGMKKTEKAPYGDYTASITIGGLTNVGILTVGDLRNAANASKVSAAMNAGIYISTADEDSVSGMIRIAGTAGIELMIPEGLGDSELISAHSGEIGVDYTFQPSDTTLWAPITEKRNTFIW